jgi:hypothetical protein
MREENRIISIGEVTFRKLTITTLKGRGGIEEAFQ